MEVEIASEVAVVIGYGIVIVALSLMAMIVGVALARIAQNLYED